MLTSYTTQSLTFKNYDFDVEFQFLPIKKFNFWGKDQWGWGNTIVLKTIGLFFGYHSLLRGSFLSSTLYACDSNPEWTKATGLHALCFVPPLFFVFKNCRPIKKAWETVDFHVVCLLLRWLTTIIEHFEGNVRLVNLLKNVYFLTLKSLPSIGHPQYALDTNQFLIVQIKFTC